MNNQFLIFGVGGLLGIAFHILFKVREMNELLPNENLKSVFAAYFKKDRIALMISVLSVLSLMYFIAGKIPAPDQPDKTGDQQDWLLYNLLKYARLSSFVIGYFGDSIIYKWLGKVGKTLADKGIDVTAK